jgi:hypothetical protein
VVVGLSREASTPPRGLEERVGVDVGRANGDRWMPSALAPDFWLVTSQAARNQWRSLRVPSKIVPAVAETWHRHVGHTLSPRSDRQAVADA